MKDGRAVLATRVKIIIIHTDFYTQAIVLVSKCT